MAESRTDRAVWVPDDAVSDDRCRREALAELLAGVIAQLSAVKLNVETGGGGGVLLADLKDMQTRAELMYARAVRAKFNPEEAAGLGLRDLEAHLVAMHGVGRPGRAEGRKRRKGGGG